MAKHSFSAKVSRNNRSRVSNGRRWLEGLDGNSREARRWRDLCRSLTADLGPDPTEAQLSLVRATATATVASERIQAKIINGDATVTELQELARLGNLQVRNLLALGLKRRSSPRSELRTYLDARGKAVTP